jgi:hypothetical protein
MAAEPCVICGNLRKVDIIWTSEGWQQPACYHCGNPGYLEPHDGKNMITIQVYDYSKSERDEGPEVRIYNETQLQEISSESGYSISEIERHIAQVKANGRNAISYLTPSSWRKIWGV